LRLGRLHVGFWEWADGRNRSWRDWPLFYLDRPYCGCTILQIGRLDLTWLSGDCLEYARKEKPVDKPLRAQKGSDRD
jgi:hypothetical protein